MIDFPIVDSHVHLCDPERLSYGWMRNAPTLNRLVRPEDLTKAAAPVRVDRFVFLEVDVDEGQQVEEARWVSDLAVADRRLQGLVASLPLERGTAVEPDLERLRTLPLLRGIRRLIQDQPDADFCVQPDFVAGVKLLARFGLTFDVCVYHRHLPNVISLVRQCPEVRFVLDHIGKPAIRDGQMDPWRADLAELARAPNVWCKISGVVTEADHRAWTREQVIPYVSYAIDTFGFDRVMFGGDWHVLGLAATYPDWVDIVDEVTAGATAEERRKLFRDTAIAFYRLEDKSGVAS